MRLSLRVSIAILLILLCLPLCAFAENTENTEGYAVGELDGEYVLTYDGAVFSRNESLSELLRLAGSLGEKITLVDLICKESIELTQGSYILSGALTIDGSLLVGADCNLSLESLTLSAGGEIRIDGGAMNVKNSSIYCRTSPVRVTGGQNASLVLDGSVIIAESQDGALLVERGEARLLSGSVENTVGAAIVNHARIHLGAGITVTGKGNDVITYSPIYLYDTNGELSSHIRLKYMSDFKKGTRTDIAYSGAANTKNNLTLTDLSGREYPTEYFDIPNQNTGAISVNLPHTVRFISDGQIISTVYVLDGERVSLPDYTVPNGYTLSGWFDSGRLFDPESQIFSDLSLECKLALNPPTYSISGKEVDYNGKYHSLCFTTLSHSLDGIYSYEWIDKEGRVVATSESLRLRDVKDSGEYKCKVLFTYGSDSVTFETDFVSFVINKRVVNIPKINDVYYNSYVQYPELFDTDLYTVERVGYIHAGEYSVPLTLRDADNCAWQECESATAYATFRILRAENRFITVPQVIDSYLGQDIRISASTLFGAPCALFSTAPDGEYSEECPLGVGQYYLLLSVDGCDDYYPLMSDPIPFRIYEDSLVSFTLTAFPHRSAYYSFELFDPSGAEFSAEYLSGRVETLSAEDVIYRYQSADSLRVRDTAVIAEYLGQTLLLPVRVSPLEYSHSLIFNNLTVVFDGEYHTLVPTGEITEGLDGTVPTYTVTGGGREVGEYTLTLTFSTDSREYNVPESISATLRIAPLPVTLVWSSDSFIYDGSLKLPSAYYLDIFGARVSATVTGSASFAGSYIATASISDPSYSVINPECSYTIEKADYDLSGVYWSESSFTYSGGINTVTLSGLPYGVTVLGYTDNTATDVGEYFARVSLGYDSRNYNQPVISPHGWRVTPAEYNLSDLVFEGGSIIYDGRVHYPALASELPVGMDGIALTHSFSHGVTNVGDNPVITVSFYTASKNYIPPESITVSLTVLPQPVSLVWSGAEFLYDGSLKCPTAYTDTGIKITVTGAEINAGHYTATAYPVSNNYLILNPTLEYTVRKARNKWTKEPTVSDIYLGQTPSPSASALSGEVIFEYYSDSALTERAEEINTVGEYYLVARVREGENTLALVSSPVLFRVLPVLPLSLNARLNDGIALYALSRLSESDIAVTLVYNDGSKRALQLSEIEVEYENLDCLSGADSFVVLTYKELSCTVYIEVDKIEYDMSGVHWSELTGVYDADEKAPTRLGLPDGVSVLEYTYDGIIRAGEYTLGALLSFDSVNYYPPTLPVSTYTVEKCPVTPTLTPVEYNGMSHTVTSQSPLYSVALLSFCNAGEYTIPVTLTDTDNYYLRSDYAIFTVLPCTVRVTVGDTVKYWLDEPRLPTYTTSGIPIGEELRITLTVVEDKVTAVTDNPNYVLKVEEGRVQRFFGFAPEVTRALYMAFLLALLLTAGVIIVAIRRESLLAIINAYRTRRIERRVLPERIEEEILSVDFERADTLLSDSVARTLVRREDSEIETSGKRRCVVNVGVLSDAFSRGERVDINSMKEKGLIPEDALFVKVLADGVIDKPLVVYANAFSLTAVKMIALTGGEAHRINTKRQDK